ncbi:MAG: hypothetical protein ABI423_02400 [Burkholderiales bacterium]
MKNFKPATVFAAIVAGVILSAVSLAAGSAASRAAGAEADYRNAIAACYRLNGGEARRCIRAADADAALREAMTTEAQDRQGGSGALEPDAAGGVMPTYRKLPAGEFLPENLARNTVR